MRTAILLTTMLLATTAMAADEAPAVSTDISKAPAGDYVLEKNHASITFKVMHMGFANYVMRFNDFDANLNLDPKNPEKSTLDVTILPASLDSHNQQLTQHTSGKDFFNIAQYPSITFKSTKIEKTSPNKGKIHGDLTMLGVTKPITLDATFNAGGQHSFFKKYDLGFSATTEVTRSEFGMKYGIPMVGDTVQVMIETEFLQK